MQVNYSDKEVMESQKSIFLAGPTPRSIHVKTWRLEALEILENLGFDGVVYVPEREFDDRNFDYVDQVDWEKKALYNANIIVFWIPRKLSDMPAFTTNVEYGYWLGKNKDKVLYGRPNQSENNRYLDWLYHTETHKKPIENLYNLLEEAVHITNQN